VGHPHANRKQALVPALALLEPRVHLTSAPTHSLGLLVTRWGLRAITCQSLTLHAVTTGSWGRLSLGHMEGWLSCGQH
jgi:hypothetical protein